MLVLAANWPHLPSFVDALQEQLEHLNFLWPRVVGRRGMGGPKLHLLHPLKPCVSFHELLDCNASNVRHSCRLRIKIDAT